MIDATFQAPVRRRFIRPNRKPSGETRVQTLMKGRAINLDGAHELVPERLDWRRGEVEFVIRPTAGARRDLESVTAITTDCPGHYVSSREGGCALVVERGVGKSFLVNQRLRVLVLQVQRASVRVLVDDLGESPPLDEERLVTPACRGRR